MARQAFFRATLWPLSTTSCPTADNNSGVNNGHVVDHRLVLVARLVDEIAVTQERAYRRVMVRQVVKAVEVAPQTLLQNPQHQDLPQFHPRTPDRAVGLRQNMLIQQRKQPGAQRLLAPDVLQPLHYRRNVVPRLRVDPESARSAPDPDELPSLNFSHRVPASRRFSIQASKSMISPPIIRHLNDLHHSNSTICTALSISYEFSGRTLISEQGGKEDNLCW